MFLNNVYITTATTGTGTITLGSAYDGNFTTEEDKAVDGLAYAYVIRQPSGSDFEEGIGVYTASGRTLTRNVVRSRISGTIGTTKLTLLTGASVAMTPLAEYLEVPSPLFGGRLTLTSVTAITEADVTAATSVYATPFGEKAGRLSLYDGVAWRPRRFSELTLALDSNSGHSGYHQSGKNFDVFAADSSGTIIVGTGPAWSSDTARGTGAGTTELELFDGGLVNKNSITLRNGSNTYSIAARQALYLGSFRATADGQTTDSLIKRLLFNAFNQCKRPMFVTDTTASWSYSTATYRQVRATTSNQLEILLGLAGVEVSARALAVYSSTSLTNGISTGVGIDTTAGDNCQLRGWNAIVSGNAVNSYDGCPGIGWHKLIWLELGDPTGGAVQTWFGANGVLGPGLLGSLII